MEPVLAVLIGCLIYIAVFILVSWLKDIFTGGSNMWCIYGILLCIAYAGSVDLYRLWKRKDDEK